MNAIAWLLIMLFIGLIIFLWTINPLIAVIAFIGVVVWFALQESSEETI